MSKLLWLPSWYPSHVDYFVGDFIQRHAAAVALYNPLQVIFVVKDELGNAGSVVIEHSQYENLGETIAYYTPIKTGLAPIDRLLSLFAYLKISRRLVRQFIKDEGIPPVVHVHVALWAGVTALWVKKKYKVPYLLTEHWTGYAGNTMNNIYERNFLFRRSIKKVVTNAALLLPVSAHLGNLIDNMFGNIDYKVIPNVVDTRYFNSTGISSPLFRFVHVSLMNYQKNAEAILHCFSRLLFLKGNVELVMVGPASSQLKALCSGLNIENNVRWTGEITYKEVASALQEASCFVMFSRYENLPCAVLEALCTGLPVIATRTGGISEVLDNSNSILVTSGNEDELLFAMKQMIDNYGEYDRDQISGKAIDKFNYRRVGGEIIEIYGSLKLV